MKNFACWGCNLGDEGLYALSQLLRGATTRTWTGSKPRLLEVVHDGAQVPADRWWVGSLEQPRCRHVEPTAASPCRCVAAPRRLSSDTHAPSAEPPLGLVLVPANAPAPGRSAIWPTPTGWAAW